MIKKLLLSAFLLALQLAVFAQKPVTICGDAFAWKGKYNNVVVLNNLKKPVGNEFIYLAQIPVDTLGKFNYKLKINYPQIVTVRYMSERRSLYLCPGDSVHISFTKTDKLDTVQIGFMQMVAQFKEFVKIDGKDAHRIGFFQLLTDKTGRLEDPPLHPSKDTTAYLNQYKTDITATYNQRMQLLKEETDSYHFKPDFVVAARNEIRALYLNSLLSASFTHTNWGNYPGYFTDIDKEDFTWQKLQTSSTYANVLYGFIMYYKQYLLGLKPKADEALLNRFNNIVALKDDSVRNYYLTIYMSKNMEDQSPVFKDLMVRYFNICTNTSYANGVMALYQPSVINKPLPQNVLNASVMGVNNQLTTLHNVLKTGKPVIIDFWASWCGPCKKEIPIIERYKATYGDKINFCFISVDKKEKHADWLKAIRENNFEGEHYLIQDESLTNFVQLKTIPRYIILDKNGTLSAFRGPNLLDDEKGFEAMLKSVL